MSRDTPTVRSGGQGHGGHEAAGIAKTVRVTWSHFPPQRMQKWLPQTQVMWLQVPGSLVMLRLQPGHRVDIWPAAQQRRSFTKDSAVDSPKRPPCCF